MTPISNAVKTERKVVFGIINAFESESIPFIPILKDVREFQTRSMGVDTYNSHTSCPQV